MPCHNPDCERNYMDEGKLLLETIRTLRFLPGKVTPELAAAIGADTSCIGCACNQIANWLEDYFYRKARDRANGLR